MSIYTVKKVIQSRCNTKHIILLLKSLTQTKFLITLGRSSILEKLRMFLAWKILYLETITGYSSVPNNRRGWNNWEGGVGKG